MIVNAEGAIRKGKIVHYLPAEPATPLVRGAVSGIYSFKTSKHNGTFTFLNIFDKKMEEYTYKDGKLKSWSAIDVKSKPEVDADLPKSGQRTQERVCTDWYWVTTYEDGSQTWEFLYRTCTDNGCRSDEECDDVGGGPSGDGGGGYGFETETFATRQKAWDVVWHTNRLWVLTSTESFEGEKSRSSGSTFTSNRHVQDVLFPTGQQLVTWVRTEMNNWGEGTSTAYAQIKGRIQIDAGSWIDVDETKPFPFNTVFQ